MKSHKKAIASSICAATLACAPFALVGCAQSIDIAGFSIGGAAHTTAADRKNHWTAKNDLGGDYMSEDKVKYTTVVNVYPKNDNRIDEQDVKSIIEKYNMNYYQLVVRKNQSMIDSQEMAFVYFPEGATYKDLKAVCSIFKDAGYIAKVMSESAFDEYASSINDVDVSTNETTFEGPAAKSAREQKK